MNNLLFNTYIIIIPKNIGKVNCDLFGEIFPIGDFLPTTVAKGGHDTKNDMKKRTMAEAIVPYMSNY